MKYRIKIGRFLQKLGKLIHSLAVVVMSPDGLMEFTRLQYSQRAVQDKWSEEDYVNKGLTAKEKILLTHVPLKQGRLLLLGIGAGREAIPLTRMGFEVIGVDFIPEMVEKARENAVRHGVKITGVIQEISNLVFTQSSFDIIWCGNEIYSFIPTQKNRIDFLKMIRRLIKPEGYVVCDFCLNTKIKPKSIGELIRKAFALATLGNLCYETGDMHTGTEFIHRFLSLDEIRFEFDRGGFEVLHLVEAGGAVIRKA